MLTRILNALFAGSQLSRLESEIDNDLINFDAGLLQLEQALDDICLQFQTGLNQTRHDLRDRLEQSDNALEARLAQIENDIRTIKQNKTAVIETKTINAGLARLSGELT